MKKQALIFERVEIRRMPGFDPPGFEVRDLCPGINIVHGPNGSGKTTLARALHAILWPRDAAPESAAVVGSLQVGGAKWLARLDGQRTLWQRDGADSGSPVLPPAEVRDRYRLALHDLLQEEATGRPFADAILRESSGGYDVAEAGTALRFREGPGRVISQSKAEKSARAKLEEVRRSQEALRADEETLAELESRAAGAVQARRRGELLDLALERSGAVREQELARRERDSYPPALFRMTGTEGETWAAIRKGLDDLARAEAGIQERIVESRGKLEALGLPPDGVPARVVTELRARLGELQRLEQERNETERELERLRTVRDDARGVLGGEVDENRLRDLDVSDLRDLSEVARSVESLRAEQKACKATLRMLGDATRPENLDRLRKGCQLLRRWMRAAGSDEGGYVRRARWIATAGGVLVVIVAALLAAVVDAAWLGLAAVGAGLVVAAWWRSGGLDEEEVHSREFEALGLEGPARWVLDDVRMRLDDLEETAASGLVATKVVTHRDEVESRSRELDQEATTLRERCRSVAERLGVSPETDEASLFWLVQAIVEGQRSDREVHGLESRLAELARHEEKSLDTVSSVVRPLGYEPLADAAVVQGLVADLDERCRKHTEVTGELKLAETRLEENEDRARKLQKDRSGLCEKLGLEPGDDVGVQDLCRRYEAFLEATRKLEQADAYLVRADNRLRTDPLFESKLIEESQESLEDEREKLQRRASERDELTRRIGGIDARVRVACEAHDLEDALAAHEKCLAALEGRGLEDYAAVVGFTLGEYLRALTRDQERPEVFLAARRIFSQVTAGRYVLEFEDGDVPAFRAIDTVSGVGHSLDELSSGTRVQLLFSVRMAFVERQEEGPLLPLLLDEVLANSDDTRARAVMEATVELARSGRQILCFTAQADEVAKWMVLLRECPDVPHRCVDLALVRGLAEKESLQVVEAVGSAAPAVPEPADRTHAEYGELLDVPPIDPGRGEGSVHVWHVVEDPDLLYRLLRLGVERAGPLRTLLACGGSDLLGGDTAQRRTEASLKAAGALCAALQVGRGKRVDRAALAASKALSDRFLDAVASLAEKLGGDGMRLLDELRLGSVKRLRGDSIERLEVHLEGEGYVDQEEPLEFGEVRARVLAAVAGELSTGQIGEDTIQRLLRSVKGRPVKGSSVEDSSVEDSSVEDSVG